MSLALASDALGPRALCGTLMMALVLPCATQGCTPHDPTLARRTLFFAGSPVARIEERVAGSGAGRKVTRTVTLEDTGETTELSATLDAQGFALTARYQRGALRTVTLEELRAHNPVVSSARVVLLDLLALVQPAAPTKATLVDLSSAESVDGSVERRGAEIVALDGRGGIIARANVEGHRTGPGAFFEGDSAPAASRVPLEIPAVDPRRVRGFRLRGVGEVLGELALAGPGQRLVEDALLRHPKPFLTQPPPWTRAPQPFIESKDARVVAWAAKVTLDEDPLAQVVRLVEAIHPLVDARKRALPPAALLMLEQGGDCDGAAALLTAGLRARGTPARPVVGYRWVEGRFVPHAWVEVYTPSGWLLADAAAPRIGDDPTYLKLFEGLGGALTMGRVLGRLELEPITASGAP